MGTLSAASAEPIHLPFLVLNLFVGLVLAFSLDGFYRRFSTTISNRHSMIFVFYFVILATTLIIMIVKTSIALSLGLVGALSIVRFRTPIREPEDLGFLFLAVAAGVGLGANQTIAVVIAFALILVILAGVFWFRTHQMGRQSGVFVNVVIPFEDAPGSELDKLSNEISSIGRNVEVRRVEINEKRITAVYTVLADDPDSLSNLTNRIEAVFSGARVSIVNDFE
ncbi:MAG: DUF4956 domain-containing protein [Rhodospirillaceae bacterium]|nr:DUF4956 domain-containing protein [Rhodospirillaceae bacterium]